MRRADVKIAGAGVRRFLERPDKALRAALLYGPNESLVREAAQSLAAWALGGSDDPYALTRLGEDEIKRDSARLADALAAQSLLGGPTIVWARISGKSADEAIVAALEALERGEPGGFLIVEAGELSSTAELAKAFAAAASAAAVAFYEETEAERAAFARALIKECGFALDRDAEDALLAALPSERSLARREIEKLALYAHDLGRRVSVDDVAALAASDQDGVLDVASGAATQGLAAQAVEALARMDALSGVSALRALLRRLHQLRDARLFIDAGLSPSEAVAKLRPPVFWKDRDAIAAQARAWNTRRIDAAYQILWKAEIRCKSAGAPQDLIAADAYRSVAELAAR